MAAINNFEHHFTVGHLFLDSNSKCMNPRFDLGVA